MAARGAVAQIAVANDPAGFYNPSEAISMFPSTPSPGLLPVAAFAITNDRPISAWAIFGDDSHSQYMAQL